MYYNHEIVQNCITDSLGDIRGDRFKWNTSVYMYVYNSYAVGVNCNILYIIKITFFLR